MIDSLVVKNRLSKFRHSLEATTLTASSFLLERSRRRPRIFFSQVEGEAPPSVPEDLQVSYQNLIHKRFDARAFRRLMGLYLAMDNIIVEEKATAEIAREVRNHPKKVFSTRSFFSPVPEPDAEASPEQQQSNLSVAATTRLTNTELPSHGQGNSRIVSISFPSRHEISEKSLDLVELSTLSDAQIQEMVQRKMKKLDKYNSFLEKKDLKIESLCKLLTEEQVAALRGFQARCRGLLIRRKCLMAIRMNTAFEQKKSYMSLKKSLKTYQDFLNGNSRAFNDSAVDVAGKR